MFVNAGDRAGRGASLVENQLTLPITPQGRLTPTSATPVLTANATAQGTIYYTPYIGAAIPTWDGTRWTNNSFSQLSLILDTSNHLSGSVYDVYVSNNGTVMGTGPAWSSTSSRGTSAAISQQNGIWVNTAAITLINNSVKMAGFGPGTCTYVGTIYATANGQTGMNFIPAASAGGAGPILGIWNAFNRVSVVAIVRDNTASWTYASLTWGTLDGSSTNRISFIDGLGVSSVTAQMSQALSMSSTADTALIGINFNSTSATPHTPIGTALTGVSCVGVGDTFLPALGFNFVQEMQATGVAGTATYYGNTSVLNQNLTIRVEM